MDDFPHMRAVAALAFAGFLTQDYRANFKQYQLDFTVQQISSANLPSTPCSTVSSAATLPVSSTLPTHASAYLTTDAFPYDTWLIPALLILLFMFWVVLLSAGIVAFRHNYGLNHLLQYNSKINGTHSYLSKAFYLLKGCIIMVYGYTLGSYHNIWKKQDKKPNAKLDGLKAKHSAEVLDLINAHHKEVSLLQFILDVVLRDTTKTHRAEIQTLTDGHAREILHLMHLHAQEIQASEGQKLALELGYLEQLEYTSTVHTAEKDQLAEVHREEMEVLKASHADHNRDVELTHVRSLAMINDDQNAELQKLCDDHHTDLAANNETWASTVRLVGMEKDLRMDILRDEHEEKLAKCLETIARLEEQVQDVKDEAAMEISTLKEELKKQMDGADENDDGQPEPWKKSKNRRKKKNAEHDPVRQAKVLKGDLADLQNSKRFNWYFEENIDLAALVAILSTFPGESSFYPQAIRRAAAAVEKAAGPQEADFQFRITQADLERGFREMAEEKTEEAKVRGTKPLRQAPATPSS